MNRVSLLNMSLKKSELLITFVFLINSHLKDVLSIHALFFASDLKDLVFNKLYYRIILKNELIKI